jgi:hypothetical protein
MIARSNGAVLYSGPSELDGAPIVVVAIGLASGSANVKTGDMIQTYILRADMSPVDAIHTGADSSICGSCVHRGLAGNGAGRTCYVNIGQGPLIVWRTLQAGGYPPATLADIASMGRGRMVRLGTYGDPAAVPSHIWALLTAHSIGHTGYTHQWLSRPELRGLCMASVDSDAERAAAQRMGWRTYRVALPGDVPRVTGERPCPAAKEAGARVQCVDCQLCDGTSAGMRASVVIQAHGGTAVMANVRRLAS